MHNLDLKDKVLKGNDTYTDKVFNIKDGIQVKLLVSPLVLNVNTDKKGYDAQDAKTPKHLKRSPFEKASSDELEIVKSYSEEQKANLFEIYDEYHQKIQKSIDELKQKNGFALILDGHALASRAPTDRPDKAGEKRADFVMGTLDDKSAHPDVIKSFYDALKKQADAHGFSIKKNYPYKGGYITQNYGKPEENVHVIQLEVSKAVYMDEENLSLNPERVLVLHSIISDIMNKTFEAVSDI